MASKTAFQLSLWDNAAIYTSVMPGDLIEIHDVKISRRDDQPIITIRFADQIVVSTTFHVPKNLVFAIKDTI